MITRIRAIRILGFVAAFLSALSGVITIFAFMTGISSIASLRTHLSRTEISSSYSSTGEILGKEKFQSSGKTLAGLTPLFTGLVDGAYSPVAALRWKFPPYGGEIFTPGWYYVGIYIGIGGVLGIMALLALASSRFQERLPRTASSLKRESAFVISLLGIIPGKPILGLSLLVDLLVSCTGSAERSLDAGSR